MKILSMIEQKPEWSIIDSSKLTEYMTCPRKFFYSHVLGWRSDYPNVHLVFGTAWHAAIEYLTNARFSDESMEAASALFHALYRPHFRAESDRDNGAKIPANAERAFETYRKRFAHEIEEYEVLYTEIAGPVMISEESTMYFKLDEYRQNLRTGRFEILDHKTTARRMSDWSDSYQLSVQMCFYNHVLMCLTGGENAEGVRVRTGFFYTSKPNEFDDAMIRKSPIQLGAFLVGLNHWYDALQTDMKLLLEVEDTEYDAMEAFPMNTTACFQYGKCIFHDFCTAWINPLTRCEETPIGFHEEFWNPLADIRVKTVMDTPLSLAE